MKNNNQAEQEPSHYDIVIIGSGPAGQKAAIQAAKLGKRVALIEKSAKLGGSSLHTGTIPSKSLRETVVNLDMLYHRTHGIEISVPNNIKTEELMFRKKVVIQEQENSLKRNLSKNNVDLYQGTPCFVSANIIEVSTEELCKEILISEIFIIATGSRPSHPSWFDANIPGVFDSDTILTLKRLPTQITVIGSGVIGCEYACIFAKLGIRVHLISRHQSILPFLDQEISEHLTFRMRNQRITMRQGESVDKIEQQDDHLMVHLVSGNKVTSPVVLVAAGRRSNIEGLGLEKIDIIPEDMGRLSVNENYQTNLPNIYAVGDVIGFPGLASTAMIQARIAVLHAFNQLQSEKMPTRLPIGIWTIPAIAMIGETEANLIEKKVSYEIGIAHFREVVRAHIMGYQEGILKLLFCPTSLKVLGVHIIGPQAAELIHLGQSVMHFNGDIKYFLNSAFNYPTLDEAYQIAAFNGLNRLGLSIES
ncbi:MAG: Si-specific NAD(P)(+) transhydrogenase [Methylococcales bacterium]|jgi:NAD(P) transhydrogenase|nr:Si-specific NAD(P)(+) transhydrogenase [Methylococcales bacterium]